MVCDNRLEAAKTIIKSLEEELEAIKKQLELLRKKNAELERLSITDELTGLYNQRHFYDRLEQEVTESRRRRQPLCLLFFDVDSLKTHNDTYGHLGGDDILKAVARSLSQSIREDSDSGYRYGGDEFAVILPKAHAEQAAEVAARINRNLRKTAFQHVTLSFGVAEFRPEMDGRALFKRADDAMYIAKKAGNAKSGTPIDKIYVYGSDIADYRDLRGSGNDTRN